MPFHARLLANGQLPAAKGTLYTVPASTATYVKFFSVFNTNTTAEVVQVWVKRATSRSIGKLTLAADEFVYFVEKDAALLLEAGDVIEGATTTASKVDYVIMGAEQDL